MCHGATTMLNAAMLEALQELVWQLHRLPGGAEAAIPDFFGALLAGPPVHAADTGLVEAWPLLEGGELGLLEGAEGLHLVRIDTAGAQPLAELPGELLAAVRQTADDPAGPYTASPLVLALMAIAAGRVEDDRRLKRALPRVDGAARDLMLMTVCRLCG